MMISAILWFLGAVILLIASRRMWIDNELENRSQCIVMCLVWPLVLGWSLVDGVRALLRKKP
jgi:hypothetical protein